MNILFVCSRNKWRSKTAEEIFKNNGRHLVLSAGTAKSARIKLSVKLIEWADVIFAMEKTHKQAVLRLSNEDVDIKVLDIPDEYEFMNDELIEILRTSVKYYLPDL